MNSKHPMKVAVVTGGHSYDVVNFHKLFLNFPKEMDIYIQHMDDFAASGKEIRQSYDAVVFYIMLMDGPADEGKKWYEGKPLTAMNELGETKQGIVILHHAILAYPQWDIYNAMVGIRERSFKYFIGQYLTIRPTIQHPITRGIRPWEMTDETYTLQEPDAGSTILLSANHPNSMKAIAWTREYKQSRIFCLQSGHDNQTWINANFQEILRRGIIWSAGRL